MEALDTVKSYSEDAAEILSKALGEYGSRLFLYKVALPYEAFFDAMPREHLRFFEELVPCHRTTDVVCAHAGADLNGEIDPSEVDVHVWGPLGFPEDYEGSAAIVYGHHNNGEVDGDWIGPAVRGDQSHVRNRHDFARGVDGDAVSRWKGVAERAQLIRRPSFVSKASAPAKIGVEQDASSAGAEAPVFMSDVLAGLKASASTFANSLALR